MRQIHVKAVAKEPKQARGKTYWGVKANDDNWYNVVQNDKPAVGALIEGEVNESEYQGRVTRWMTPTPTAIAKQVAQAASNGNGKPHLNQFIMAEAFEFYWNVIKGAELTDDAKARVLCTMLISTSNGSVSYEMPPEVDEEAPF